MKPKAKSQLSAILDIGSHSIKMYVFELNPSHSEWKIVDSLWLPIQLGTDIFMRGSIRQETLHNLSHILSRFQQVKESYHITDIKAFITSSLSEASNSESVLSRCQSILGITPNIIHPYQENEAIYMAVAATTKNHREFNNTNLVIFHVGSSSSRLFIQHKGKLIWSQTYHTGTLRFGQFLPKSTSAYPVFFHPFIKHISTTIQKLLNNELFQLILLNDDLIHMLEHTGIKEEKHLYKLSKQQIAEFSLHFLTLPDEELEVHYGIPETTVPSVRISLAFFVHLLENLQQNFLYLPHTMSTMGFVYELFQREREKIFHDILSSAMTIARRYEYDEVHATTVQMFAREIFKALEQTFSFSPLDRIYLEGAAILHDIGYFIGATNHHKNTYELVKRSEIFGLSPDEIMMIALITRYHRKSSPKKTHAEFMALDIHKRITVTGLSAILRIANALDSSHMQIVSQLKARKQQDNLILECHIQPYLSYAFEVIETAVQNNKGFFENFFGLKVVIEKR